MERVYDVEGMHCAACTQKITAALEGLPGVARAEATLTPRQAKVEMSNPVPIDTLQAAVASAGSYRLRERAESATPTKAEENLVGAPKESLFPLILIVSYLTGAVFLIETASGQHRAVRLSGVKSHANHREHDSALHGPAERRAGRIRPRRNRFVRSGADCR